MAILVQSENWPIHRVRQLHAEAQRQYLWQIDLGGAAGIYDETIRFLAQSVQLPGVNFERVNFSVGGREISYLSTSSRGGIVAVSYLELEGGKVDQFFRTWFDLVDVPKDGSVSRARRVKEGQTRGGLVTMFKRGGGVSMRWRLGGLLPLSIGPYQFNYGENGETLVSVQMSCDEVRRVTSD